MLGTIIGDIIGSPYEFNNIKSKNFELFTKCSHFTDDSVMTVAIGNAINTHKEHFMHTLVGYMREFGQTYFYAGYGKSFKEWLFSKNPKPYGSYGNGAAMRVSAIPYIFTDLDKCLQVTEDITNVTHNHPQSINGAKAVVHAMWLALKKETKSTIHSIIEAYYGYNLEKSLDEIRDDYKFDVSCDGSVPQAIRAFLESTSYEDAVRNAVSIGGDSDTIAAIAGGIAEAFYGYIPMKIIAKASPLIPDDFIRIIDEVRGTYNRNLKK